MDQKNIFVIQSAMTFIDIFQQALDFVPPPARKAGSAARITLEEFLTREPQKDQINVLYIPQNTVTDLHQSSLQPQLVGSYEIPQRGIVRQILSTQMPRTYLIDDSITRPRRRNNLRHISLVKFGPDKAPELNEAIRTIRKTLTPGG